MDPREIQRFSDKMAEKCHGGRCPAHVPRTIRFEADDDVLLCTRIYTDCPLEDIPCREVQSSDWESYLRDNFSKITLVKVSKK